MTSFAFIGFGEAGGILADGLKETGATLSVAYDILIDDPASAEAFRQRALDHGIKAAASTGDAVGDADIVISAVVSSQTVAAARAAAPHLRQGQIYMDINSTSPAAKREAATMIENHGVAYVEAAVMALFPANGHRAPMLLAGAEAERLAGILAAHDMQIEAIGETIGTASAIKMIRSVFLKGFTAILLECLLAAAKVGAEERVLESIQGTFPELDWRALADYYTVRLVKHAKRQASEMDAVAETLRDLGVDPVMAAASGKRLGWLADIGLDGKLAEAPADYAAVLKAIDEFSGKQERA